MALSNRKVIKESQYASHVQKNIPNPLSLERRIFLRATNQKYLVKT